MTKNGDGEKKDRNELKTNLILLVVVCLICFLILEVTVRMLGQYDSDGEFNFNGHRIKPYTLPSNSIARQIAEFEKNDKPHDIPDPYLGWTVSNNTVPSDERYFSNSIGIRSHKEFDIKKPDDVIRIAMYGDSFIYSYDVPMEQSIAYHLENKLSKEYKIEIMNFGGGGYGIDQAYLRWKLLGSKYNPDIVIIGFQAGNCRRNVNIIRKLYARNSGIPFSKPRFYLENNTLKLINYPTVPYYKLPEIVKNFENSELRKFEYFYNPDDYEDHLIYHSKAIAVLLEYIDFFNRPREEENNDKLFFQIDSNESKLCYEIISTFYKETSNDSKVYLLHIPLIDDLDRKMNGKDYIYDQLLHKLENNFNMINPDVELLNEAKNTSIQSLFVGHYSNKSNYIIANVIYDQLHSGFKSIETSTSEKENK